MGQFRKKGTSERIPFTLVKMHGAGSSLLVTAHDKNYVPLLHTLFPLSLFRSVKLVAFGWVNEPLFHDFSWPKMEFPSLKTAAKKEKRIKRTVREKEKL